MQSSSPQEPLGPCWTTRLLVSMLNEMTMVVVVAIKMTRTACQWVMVTPILAD